MGIPRQIWIPHSKFILGTTYYENDPISGMPLHLGRTEGCGKEIDDIAKTKREDLVLETSITLRRQQYWWTRHVDYGRGMALGAEWPLFKMQITMSHSKKT